MRLNKLNSRNTSTLLDAPSKNGIFVPVSTGNLKCNEAVNPVTSAEFLFYNLPQGSKTSHRVNEFARVQCFYQLSTQRLTFILHN
jgi:hypothetical protein